MTAPSEVVTNPEIQADNLTLRYGETTALSRLAVTLSGSGIHGLLGRNGSGKTSLLSLVAGLRKPTDGNVRVFGEPVFENPRVTTRLCLIREDGDLLDGSDTLAGVLAFESGLRPFWNNDVALALLDGFELSPKKKLGALSRGQRSAVACTVGIASRAPITLFDESYLGMDAPARYAFYDALLADYIAHPRLIILSTHLIDEVARLFDQVLVIHEGTLMLQQDAESLRGRGVKLTGPADTITRLTAGLPVLEQRDLGTTRAVSVDAAPATLAAEARAAGLTVEPLPLQDLFVALTRKGPSA